MALKRIGQSGKPLTVLEACVLVRGVHAGALTAKDVALAAMLTVKLGGRFPTAPEYADYWAVSERTAFKQWSGIAEVFGPDWRELVIKLAGEIEAKQEQRLRPVTKYRLPRGTRVATA